MNAGPELAARLLVIVSAVLFSTGGAIIKATTLAGWQVACLRSGIAVLTVLLILPASRRRPTVRVLLVGVTYAATLIFFVQATKMTTGANAIFLQAAAPLYVVLLGPWLLREPVRAQDLLFLGIMAAGLYLIFSGAQQPQATAPNPGLGNVLGALSGLSWALTLCGLRFLGRRTARADDDSGAASAVVVGNLMACVATLPLALPLTGVTTRDAVAILYLGVVQIGVAYACLTTGLRHVGALPATLLLFVEPVLNPVWTYLVHGERIGLLALAGGALILAATFARSIVDLRRPAEVSGAIDTPRSVG